MVVFSVGFRGGGDLVQIKGVNGIGVPILRHPQLRLGAELTSRLAAIFGMI